MQQIWVHLNFFGESQKQEKFPKKINFKKSFDDKDLTFGWIGVRSTNITAKLQLNELHVLHFVLQTKIEWRKWLLELQINSLACFNAILKGERHLLTSWTLRNLVARFSWCEGFIEQFRESKLEWKWSSDLIGDCSITDKGRLANRFKLFFRLISKSKFLRIYFF